MEKIGIVILAAGGSKRLGQPKQLLKYKEGNLLQHIISVSTKLTDVNVVVVIGSCKAEMLSTLSNKKIAIVVNEDWQSGMASSIKIGLQNLINVSPNLPACMFAVCDQPYISTELLRMMIDEFKKNKSGIIAATYKDIIGTPVLLNKKYFEAIFHLTQEEGAKKIVQTFRNDVATIAFDKGDIDIDTPDDYKKLMNAER